MRHRSDPDQSLFRWVWADERPEPEPTAAPPPPLRGRVAQRHGPKIATLWGVSITVVKAPRGRAERRQPEPERKCTH